MSSIPGLTLRDRRLVAASGVAGLVLAAGWWMAVLLAGSARLDGRLLVLLVRPERLLGWAGARNQQLFFVLFFIGGALLLAALALGLARVLRRGPTVASALLVIAAISHAVVGAFPNDARLYQESPVRGVAGAVLVPCLAAGVVLAGVGLGRIGRRVASRLTVVAGVAIAWVALVAIVLAAIGGAPQPQLAGVVVVEALATPWYAGIGLWLLLSAARAGNEVRGVPASRALRTADVALGTLGAAVTLLTVLAAGVVVGPTAATQLSGGTSTGTMRQGAVVRTYRLHRPPAAAARPGLVIVLHGAYGDGYQAEVQSGFDAQADRLSWVAAYPDGVADGWDTFGDDPSWGQHPGVDDVAFIAALIDRLEATDRVDPSRVYVTGFSRGAMMSYRIGCELSSRVAAIAPVSGNMATASGSALAVDCRPSRPVSVLTIHGSADPIVPVQGGHTDITYAPLSDVALKWRELNGCGDRAAVAVAGPSTTTAWQCAGRSTVITRVVAGGVHAWPGSVANQVVTPNAPDRSFDATALIADFFVAHPAASATAP
jgi:polyhydroxybutyrate depolymerase